MHTDETGLWSPPPDAEKPRCPYTTGFTVEITHHTPPPPFGTHWYGIGSWPTDGTWEWLRSVTQTTHVLHYPPLESKASASNPIALRKARLTITNAIAVRDGRGPQLVLCSVAPKLPGPTKETSTVVAKIFDPLYYSFRNEIAGDEPVDVAFEADGDYSREAAAYQHLKQTNQTGSFAPDYYGSWTFNLPICHQGVVRQRPVRLILIEHLQGTCMRELCNDLQTLVLNKAYRLGVLAKILDNYMRQEHEGLGQNDLAPRNIILVPTPKDSPGPQPIPRVVLIDYNNAVVYSRTADGHDQTKLPLSPLQWYWLDTLPQFEGWRPPEWSKEPRSFQEWLLREFGGKNAAKYERPTRELKLAAPRTTS